MESSTLVSSLCSIATACWCQVLIFELNTDNLHLCEWKKRSISTKMYLSWSHSEEVGKELPKANAPESASL